MSGAAERLPLLLSVPHAGLAVPAEVADACALSPSEIARDGDEQAGEIYAVADRVRRHVTTDVARAVVDMNRAEDDRRKDGIVKTHTCWDVSVWRRLPPEPVLRGLIDGYWRPYHRRLREAAADGGVVLGLDGHTMASHGPPVGPDPGRERPHLCLGNGRGATCSDETLRSLAACLERTFGAPVALNSPFAGGYIVHAHAVELPWVQLELSRAPWIDPADKRRRLLAALEAWCGR